MASVPVSVKMLGAAAKTWILLIMRMKIKRSTEDKSDVRGLNMLQVPNEP